MRVKSFHILAEAPLGVLFQIKNVDFIFYLKFNLIIIFCIQKYFFNGYYVVVRDERINDGNRCEFNGIK